MIKSEKGSVTLIVMVTVLFILIVLSANLMFVSTKRKSQLQESEILENVYGGNIYDIYTEKSNKLLYNNYISNNLLVYYDAINNTGSGHSNTATTWKNLAGNSSYDGKINGAIFHDNYLSFDGVDDWVGIGQISGQDGFTLDCTVQRLKPNSYILGNLEAGGIFLNFAFDCRVYTTINGASGAYRGPTTTLSIDPNKIYNVVATYDGSEIRVYINGVLNVASTVEGVYKEPANNTIFAMGTNPSQDGPSSPDGYATMNVYSCRIYNRVLSDTEITNNYELDKSRYSIEE